MANAVQAQRRREAWSYLSSWVGALAELVVDTTNRRLLIHDGQTPGGFFAYAAYGANNSSIMPNSLEGEIETLTTGGSTYETDLEIPAGALLVGVSLFVETAITGCTQYELGLSGQPSLFGSGLTAVAKGASLALPVAALPVLANTPLLLTSTAGGNITGGAIRFCVHYLSFGAPQA
jgi:Major tropism determinant N-terminal domain